MHLKGPQGKGRGKGEQAPPHQVEPGRELVLLCGKDASLAGPEPERNTPSYAQQQDPKHERTLGPAPSLCAAWEGECPRQPAQDKARPDPDQQRSAQDP